MSRLYGPIHRSLQDRFDARRLADNVEKRVVLTEIPPEHLEALLERVREVAKPHGKRLRGMLCTVIVGFRSPTRN